MNLRNIISMFCHVSSAFMMTSAYASQPCTMLEHAEPQLIKQRVAYYADVLKINPTLQQAATTAFYHKETFKTLTLKQVEDDMSATQLDALSRAGCEPWQGAAFNINLYLTMARSAYKIFNQSANKDEALRNLNRLTVNHITLIPADLKAND